MATFYKGNDIFKDITLEHYIKGERQYQGTYIKITDPVNKYNKDFVTKVNDLNTNFYKLVRANKIATLLIYKYHDKAVEAQNLMHLMKSQAGTIRFNRIFKKALLKYGIKHQNIYNSIKKNIDKQYDRLSRNSKLIDMLLDDFGLTVLLEVIKDETGFSFPEYIYNLESTFPIEKPIFFGEDNSEEENKWYDDLTSYQLSQIDKLIEKHGIDISGTISEGLEKHRENMQVQKQEQKEEKAELNQQELLDKANNLIHDNCAHIQHDITAGYNEKHLGLAPDEAYLLFKKVQAMTKVCNTAVVYYIAAVKVKQRSIGKLQYVSGIEKDKQTLVYNINNMSITPDIDQAQEISDKLKIYDASYIVKVQRILFSENNYYNNDKEQIYKYTDFCLAVDEDSSNRIDAKTIRAFNRWLVNMSKESERIKEEIAEAHLHVQRLRANIIDEKQRKLEAKARNDWRYTDRKYKIALRQKAERKVKEQKEAALKVMNDPSKLDSLIYEINNTKDELVLYNLYKRIGDAKFVYCIEAIGHGVDKIGSCYVDNSPFVNINLYEYGICAGEWYPCRELIDNAKYFVTNIHGVGYCIADADYRIFMKYKDYRKVIDEVMYNGSDNIEVKTHRIPFNNPLLSKLLDKSKEQKNSFMNTLYELSQDESSQTKASFDICRERGYKEVYCITFMDGFELKYYDARLKTKKFRDRGSSNPDDISLYPELGRAQYELQQLNRSLKEKESRTRAKIIKLVVT